MAVCIGLAVEQLVRELLPSWNTSIPDSSSMHHLIYQLPSLSFLLSKTIDDTASVQIGERKPCLPLSVCSRHHAHGTPALRPGGLFLEGLFCSPYSWMLYHEPVCSKERFSNSQVDGASSLCQNMGYLLSAHTVASGVEL